MRLRKRGAGAALCSAALCSTLFSGALVWTSAVKAGPLQVPSPDWRDQVIYFVLTDRFDDGDPHNNDQGAGEYNPADPSRYSGGDLRGIERRLHYIQQLGATAVWLTPPVANQWYSPHVQYGGYHGYWATDFKAVDAHLGTLADYQRLSRVLHGRGMYLIQDIVLNHTGNFFGYQGHYNPQDPSANFVLYQDPQQPHASPVQFPFDQLDARDPSQRRIAAYHFTPPIQDASQAQQQTEYQVGQLADLNTANPLVRQVLKDSYRFWLEQVGVDAFRIDTAKYVEHAFWHDFMHSPDGVLATARRLGKSQFLAFGEVFESSTPFDAAGERKLLSYLGTATKPELNSVLAFPLYTELNRVLAEGQPPAQLADRLAKQLQLFPDAGVLPTFLNNHDTKRFVSVGSNDAFLQGYAVLFTIPGIPVIYQGDEQLLGETRQAMFAGGYGSRDDHFNPHSWMYQQIASLATLRKQHSVLRRGEFRLLHADRQAAGILAYQLQDPRERLIVLLNTADAPRLVSGLPLTTDAQSLPLRWQHGLAGQADVSGHIRTTALTQVRSDARGELTMLLPPRAVLVLQAPPLLSPLPERAASGLQLTTPPPATVADTQHLTGHGASANGQIQLVLDGDLQALAPVTADANGHFSAVLPVQDYGKAWHTLVLLDSQTLRTSPHYRFQTVREHAALSVSVDDVANDDHGPTGQYTQPTQQHSQRQLDIRHVDVKAAGTVLELTLTMAQVSQFWAPDNGFDNVHFSIYFAVPSLAAWPSQRALPGLQSDFPGEDVRGWQLGHQVFGWGNSIFSAKGASATQTGHKLAGAPDIEVDVAAKQIRLRYQGRGLGVADWAGSRIYISTWDKTGEGALRQLQREPSLWNFGGASAQSAKVMDDVLLMLPSAARSSSKQR